MGGIPEDLKVRVPTPREAAGMREVRSVLLRLRLHSICEGAQCPNAVECWSARTATFLLLGDVCTRSCRFCAVTRGLVGAPLDPDEPRRLAEAVRELGLRHVVLTSVDRDDLPDGGASGFVTAVAEIHRTCRDVAVEVLIPDFGGSPQPVKAIAESGARVLSHNVETVRRLTPKLRDRRASYDQSLRVLELLAASSERRVIKSGLMVGLGERSEEVVDALRDLRAAGVAAVTLGQYLSPSRAAAPVVRWVSRGEFSMYAEEARALGFSHVLSGPRVRSSYHAEALLLPPCAASST
ncbi:MAG: lipoyl synthase [Candidatus Bipolaricaulota bacterium]